MKKRVIDVLFIVSIYMFASLSALVAYETDEFLILIFAGLMFALAEHERRY